MRTERLRILKRNRPPCATPYNPKLEAQNTLEHLGSTNKSLAAQNYQSKHLVHGMNAVSTVPRRLITNHPSDHVLYAIPRLLLDLSESHHSTALAFKVLYQATQQLILSATTSTWTSVEVLLMIRTLEMAVQGLQSAELSITQVTLVAIAIPRSLRSDGLQVRIARHRDHRFSDDIVAVQATNGVVEARAINVGVGTCARLKVDRDTSCCGESILAEGALNRGSHVDSRVQMLIQIVLADERASARDTVRVTDRIGTMLMKS